MNKAQRRFLARAERIHVELFLGVLTPEEAQQEMTKLERAYERATGETPPISSHQDVRSS